MGRRSRPTGGGTPGRTGLREGLSVDIGVAVIARPESPTLDACLTALHDAGATAEVIEIGSDGPGMARNRALAACRGEVLALVEDDVAVRQDWREALEASWTRTA